MGCPGERLGEVHRRSFSVPSERTARVAEKFGRINIGFKTTFSAVTEASAQQRKSPHPCAALSAMKSAKAESAVLLHSM
jgi:hypothetical protein